MDVGCPKIWRHQRWCTEPVPLRDALLGDKINLSRAIGGGTELSPLGDELVGR